MDKRTIRKLSPAQLFEIEQRVLDGESQRALAKEFGMSSRGLNKAVGENVKKIAKTAVKLAEAQTALNSLPVSGKISAQTLAEKLMSITDNISSAAETSARTAYRLSKLAHEKVQTINLENLEDEAQNLRMVNGLTNMANEASKIPLGLLQSNKEQVQRLSEPEQEKVKTLDDFYARRTS
jgi:hypothetical protein